jgi:oligopeptide transport system substrate-binding protein
MRDSPSELKAYEQGALDLTTLGQLSPAEIDQARQRHPDEYVSMPVPTTSYIGFDAGSPPFDDLRVRRAFALATDRAKLADVVERGLVFPATGGLVPPGVPGHSPGIGLPYDPEQARLLLAEAGFAHGSGFPDVECLARQGRGGDAALDYLETVWLENLGIQVRWTRLAFGALLDRLQQRKPHLWLTGWMADYADPDNFLRVASWRHQAGWHNWEYDELIDAARRVSDPQRRIEMYRHADRILVEEAPIVPLGYGLRHILVKPWVTTRSLGSYTWFYKDFTIEPH